MILKINFPCKLMHRQTLLLRNLELFVFEIRKWNFARGFFEFKFVINLSRFWNLKILVHLLLKLLLIIYQPLRTHVNIFDKFSEFSPRKLWKSKMNLVLNWNACHVKEHNIQALKNSKAFWEKFYKIGRPKSSMVRLLVQWMVAYPQVIV